MRLLSTMLRPVKEYHAHQNLLLPEVTYAQPMTLRRRKKMRSNPMLLLILQIALQQAI